MSLLGPRFPRLAVALALLAGLTLGSAATLAQDTTTAVRVLTVDGETGQLTVLDPESGEAVGTFSTPTGGFTPLYTSPDGRYFLANHYDGGAVTVVDSGLELEDHGDHMDLHVESPFVQVTVRTGGAPAHYWSHGEHVAVYDDATGEVTLFDEAALSGEALPVTFPTGEPDHASIAILGETLLVGTYEGGTIAAYSLTGELLEENVIDCPATHGETISGDAIYFACGDGLAVITETGGELSGEKVAYPADGSDATPVAGDEEGANPRSNLLAAHEDSAYVVGDLPDGLLVLETGGASEPSTMALPAAPLWMDFAEDGGSLLVLTADGYVHGIDPGAGEVLWSSEVVTPYSSFDQAEASALYPFIAVGADTVFVPDPVAGTVVEVAVESGEVVAMHEVGGQPARVAVVVARGATH